jgi:hypothetical protein
MGICSSASPDTHRRAKKLHSHEHPSGLLVESILTENGGGAVRGVAAAWNGGRKKR